MSQAAGTMLMWIITRDYCIPLHAIFGTCSHKMMSQSQYRSGLSNHRRQGQSFVLAASFLVPPVRGVTASSHHQSGPSILAAETDLEHCRHHRHHLPPHQQQLVIPSQTTRPATGQVTHSAPFFLVWKLPPNFAAHPLFLFLAVLSHFNFTVVQLIRWSEQALSRRFTLCTGLFPPCASARARNLHNLVFLPTDQIRTHARRHDARPPACFWLIPRQTFFAQRATPGRHALSIPDHDTRLAGYDAPPAITRSTIAAVAAMIGGMELAAAFSIHSFCCCYRC